MFLLSSWADRVNPETGLPPVFGKENEGCLTPNFPQQTKEKEEGVLYET
jgi:hypothetical protein